MDYISQQRCEHSLDLKMSVELEIRIPSDWVKKLVQNVDVVFVSKDFAKDHGNLLNQLCTCFMTISLQGGKIW